jgi:hypothetical protein
MVRGEHEDLEMGFSAGMEWRFRFYRIKLRGGMIYLSHAA